MKSVSSTLQIDELEQYDAAENLLYLLQKLDLKTAKPVLKGLKYDFKADFYCGDCEQPRDDCYGHDDYPDYSLDDYDYDTYKDDKISDGDKPTEK